MKDVTEIEFCKKVLVEPLKLHPFEVLRYLEPASFDKVDSARIEFGHYSVGRHQIIGVAHVSHGKVVRIEMLPSPGIVPIEAVENEEIKELVSMVCDEMQKTKKSTSRKSMPLSEFLDLIQQNGKATKRASNKCIKMKLWFTDCWAVCCDFENGMPCWWVCPGHIDPF